MFFKQKGKLRKEFNQQLIKNLETTKDEWKKQKDMIKRCVEPSEEILFQFKISEAKYLFLIREAKSRKVSLLR